MVTPVSRFCGNQTEFSSFATKPEAFRDPLSNVEPRIALKRVLSSSVVKENAHIDASKMQFLNLVKSIGAEDKPKGKTE